MNKKVFNLFVFSLFALVGISALSITSSCSQAEQPKIEFVNDPILEKKYIQYRVDFIKKWYELAKQKTNEDLNSFPNGWLPEYDVFLRKKAVDPKIGINTNLDWWVNWNPFDNGDISNLEQKIPPNTPYRIIYAYWINDVWKQNENYYEFYGQLFYIGDWSYTISNINGNTVIEDGPKLLTYGNYGTIRVNKQ